MFLERYLIVVSGLRVPLMPYPPSSYVPTWVEWSVLAGAFAGFALIIAVFTEILPVISIWEVEEHREHEEAVKLAERSLREVEAARELEAVGVRQPVLRTALSTEGQHETS